MLKFMLALLVVSSFAIADVADSDPLTQLPANTVLVFKSDVNIRPNTSDTLLVDETATQFLRLMLPASPNERLIKAGTRTVFNSAKYHVPVSEFGTPSFDGQHKCGMVLYLNTEGGTFFNVQSHTSGNCDAVPTVGALRGAFDLEFPSPEIIKSRP